MQRIPTIFVMESDLHGKGVFTHSVIEKGALLEICPVIIIPNQEIKYIDKTILHDYYFTWGKDQTEAAIVLGFGSIYNHAVHSKAKFIMDYEQHTMDFVATETIAAGEEITINYNGESGNAKALWFEPKK